MRWLVFSDVHGNLPAFERMVAVEKGIDQYVCLGDVVNYGPWGNECVDLLETLPAIRLMGNHEEYFLRGAYPGKTELVKQFFQHTYARFERHAEIAAYQPLMDAGGFRFVHTIEGGYVFADTPVAVAGHYFIGHSHHQFERRSEAHHIVNVGSVGQNRKYINRIDYALFDVETAQVELKNLIYDVDVVISQMRSLGFAAECVAYYLNKPRL